MAYLTFFFSKIILMHFVSGWMFDSFTFCLVRKKIKVRKVVVETGKEEKEDGFFLLVFGEKDG